MKEEWKDIKGYEERYQISNFGRVKSLYFKNNKYIIKKEKILKPYTAKDGYSRIGLSNAKGKRKNFYVHRLVAMAFIPNPKNLPLVNHKDECKSNNFVNNLEWCTTLENNRYSFNLHKERINVFRTDYAIRKNGLKHRKPVAQLDKYDNLINIFDGAITAEEKTGFDASTISNCCRGLYKYAYGFKWKYITREEFITLIR